MQMQALRVVPSEKNACYLKKEHASPMALMVLLPPD